MKKIIIFLICTLFVISGCEYEQIEKCVRTSKPYIQESKCVSEIRIITNNFTDELEAMDNIPISLSGGEICYAEDIEKEMKVATEIILVEDNTINTTTIEKVWEGISKMEVVDCLEYKQRWVLT